MNLRNAAQLVGSVFGTHFRMPPVMSVEDWANENRVLPRKTSSEPGPWRTSRTPYLRQPLNDLSDDALHQTIVLQFGTQTGKSEAGLNWAGYLIDRAPGPMMIVQPTVELAKRYSRQRFAPMIESTRALSMKIKENRSRDSGNTLLLKEFPAGIVMLAGSNSAASLASAPARYIHADECDDYPLDVDGQGDPIQVVTARQDTFSRRKKLLTSTPKRPTGFSTIETWRLAGTDFRYYVPCPLCGHSQQLVWGGGDDFDGPGLRFTGSDFHDSPKTARYLCESCLGLFEEHHKTVMLPAGVWIAENPGRDIQSYLLSSLYSPLGWCSWEKIVSEYLAAKAKEKIGDDGPYKAWVNTRLALTYKETGAKLSEQWLRDKVEIRKAGVVAKSCVILTAGIDTQDNRLEGTIWGIGPDEETCVVEHFVIWGDPLITSRSPGGQPTVWERLDDQLAKRYPHESDSTVTLAVEGVAIDTGGHCTHAVYDYCRRRMKVNVYAGGRRWVRRTYAIKGSSLTAAPIKGRSRRVDIDYNGEVVKGGVLLWQVGTNQAKDLLMGRLKVKDVGPGYVHIPNGMPDDWFEQMTSEQRIRARTKRGYQFVWAQEHGKRNEGWDCAVYALFAAQALDVHRWTQSTWDRIKKRLIPKPAAAAIPKSKATRKRGVKMRNKGL